MSTTSYTNSTIFHLEMRKKINVLNKIGFIDDDDDMLPCRPFSHASVYL